VLRREEPGHRPDPVIHTVVTRVACCVRGPLVYVSG